MEKMDQTQQHPVGTEWSCQKLLAGVALAMCRTPYHDHARETLWGQLVISMAVVYVLEDWPLATFTETAYLIEKVKEDTWGILSLTRLHKDAKFYPDISYAVYGQHMTLAPLTPSSRGGLELCGAAENFTAGALHWQPKQYCKGKDTESWAQLAFQKAPAGELQSIAGSLCKAWSGGSSRLEQHEVKCARISIFACLLTDESGQPILSDYTFALCLPGEWPFSHIMDPDILSKNYILGGLEPMDESLHGDPVDTGPSVPPTVLAKKSRKHKGKSKNRNRSKSASAISSASEVSPNHSSRDPGPRVELVMQDLELSSDGPDSDDPD